MKKGLLLMLFAIIALTVQVQAGNADLFSYDKAAIETEFADLQTLEDYVYNHQSTTLTDLLASGSALVANLNLMGSNPFGPSLAFDDPPLGIPSFIWGCVFGVAGLAVVYFVTEDDEETKKALWGCITSTVVGVVFYFTLWGVIFSSAATI